MPCVIYCHGNCGSRCDALDAVQILLPYNITVLAFDFSGSGLSEGDYVSLGFFEKQDLASIVEHLWDSKQVSRIGLWGRSMGAATSVMYSNLDHTIAGIVVDSPFTSLEDIMTELVLAHQSWVPKKAIKLGINVMRKSILNRAQFDIRKNSPIEYAKNCYVPALFAHAEGDDFIKIHHSERLYEVYSGDKNMIRFEGDHNSERPEFFYDSVTIFFVNVLISNDPNLNSEDNLRKKTTKKKPLRSSAPSSPNNNNNNDHGMTIDTEGFDARNVTEEDEDDEDEEAMTPTDGNASTHDLLSILRGGSNAPKSKKMNRMFDNEIGELPKSPNNDQIHLPHSLSHPHMLRERLFDEDQATQESNMEQVELYQALAESLRLEISTCKDDNELRDLNTRLDEIILQAKNEQIEL